MASLALVIPSGRAATTPVTLATYSAAEHFARFDDFSGRVGGIEDDLGDAVAVAEVDEQAAAVVAVGVDPAAEGDGVADM